MISLDILSMLFIIILLINSFFVIFSGIRSLIITKTTKFEAFYHLQITWIFLGLFWFSITIIELFHSLKSLELLILLNYLLLAASPFILEFFYFYLLLFSNRLHYFERYIPVGMGIIIGVSFCSIIVNDEFLQLFSILLVSVIGILIIAQMVILIKRILPIQEKISKDQKEFQFLLSLQKIIIFTIIGGGFDAIWFPLAIISQDLLSQDIFYEILTIGFGLLVIFSYLFTIEVGKILKSLNE
ncbi:MAG: hypothetical protein ACXAC7_18795, partial [Candidatus Hodarchaeales archaeon]